MALPSWLTKTAAQGLQYGANINQALGDNYGATNMRNASSAIRDPNQVYTGGIGGLFDGKSNFSAVSGRSNGGNVLGESTSRLTNDYGDLFSQRYNESQSNGPTPQETADREAALYNIDNGITGANQAMGNLDRQRDIGLGNINRDYQDAYGRLVGQRRMAEADYGQNKTNQLNEYQSARNQSANNSRSWMDGARRTLGTQGAGGGSAARYAVPNQAQEMAAQGNAQAQSVNNRNITALDQNWRRTEDEFGNSINGLQRQKQQGENDLNSRITKERVNLTNTIASLTGQRRLANGGNYQQAMAESQPYTSRIPGMLAEIDTLSATPAIRERQVTVGRPDLAGYNFARPEAPTAAVQDPTLSNPVLAALFGQQDEQQYA